MKLEEITGKYEFPRIGVIGATSPTIGYDSADSYRLGQELRRILEKKGSLFTGGMPGVGLDFYEGVADYCSERKIDDKFFVIFPEGHNLPEEYLRLAEKTKNGVLRVERAGKDFEERRTYVGAVADALVVINGSEGTVDEALKGLFLGKPVICLENSGGAAKVISKFKRGEIPGIPLEVDRELIKSFDSVTDVVTYLSGKEFYKLVGARK